MQPSQAKIEQAGFGPTICDTCNTALAQHTDGSVRCKCPDKHWRSINPVRGNEETEALLKQKGYTLAPCGWYYYGHGLLLTIFENNTWRLENTETPLISDLREYLSSLPDVATT